MWLLWTRQVPVAKAEIFRISLITNSADFKCISHATIARENIVNLFARPSALARIVILINPKVDPGNYRLAYFIGELEMDTSTLLPFVLLGAPSQEPTRPEVAL